MPVISQYDDLKESIANADLYPCFDSEDGYEVKNITGEQLKALLGGGGGAGSGDVVGPNSSTNSGIVRYEGLTGKIIQTGPGVITDAGVLSGLTNVNWDLAFVHSSSDGSDHSLVGLNNTHRTSNGSDHSGVALNTTHRTSAGTDHSDVVLNSTHRGSDGTDHSQVGFNVSHRTSTGASHTWINQSMLTTDSVTYAGLTIGNTITNISIDGSLAGDSDSNLVTEKAVKAYADNLLAVNDALVYKGALDCSTNPDYPAADAGHRYVVSVAGKIGGASGVVVAVNDTFTCYVDGSLGGDQAAVGAEWNVITGAAPGSVIGPVSSTDNALVRFDTTTGKLVQNSVGILTDAGVLSGVTNTNWDLAYTHISNDGTDHSDVGLNNTHRASNGSDHSLVGLNTTHRTSTGADHGWLDQAVLTTSTAVFAGVTLTNNITLFSTDNTLAGNADTTLVSEKAIKAFVAASVPVASVNAKTGVVVLAGSDIGLGDVDNTTDLLKPISTATQDALDLKAAVTHAASHTDGTDDLASAGAAQIGLVDLTTQTWTGVKTFTSFPVGPSAAPTTDYQLANKKYVDDNGGGGGGGDVTLEMYSSQNSRMGFLSAKDILNDGLTGPTGGLDWRADMFEDETMVNTTISEADYSGVTDSYTTNYTGAGAIGTMEVTGVSGETVTGITIGGDQMINGTETVLIPKTTYNGSEVIKSSDTALRAPGDQTICCKVNFTTLASANGILANDNLGTNGFRFQAGSGTHMVFYIFHNSGTYSSPSYAMSLATDYQIIFSQNATTGKAYIRITEIGGSDVVNAEVTPTQIWSTNTSSADMCFGSREPTGAAGMNGDLWDVEWYDEAQTATTDTDSYVYGTASSITGFVEGDLRIRFADGDPQSNLQSFTPWTTIGTPSTSAGGDLIGDIVSNINTYDNTDFVASSPTTGNSGVITLTASTVGVAGNSKALVGAGTATFSNEVDTAGGKDATANGFVQTASFTAASSPDTIRPMIIHDWATTGTMNTDLVVSVSRTGAAPFEAATMVDQGVFIGTQHWYTAEVDVSGQAAGTDIVTKIQGANAVESLVYGNVLQLGV